MCACPKASRPAAAVRANPPVGGRAGAAHHHLGQRGQVWFPAPEAVDELGAVNQFVVRVEGSLWNAQCPAALSPGARVVVTGFDAMTLDIALVDAGTPRSGQAR